MEIKLIIKAENSNDTPLLYMVKAKIIEYINKIPEINIKCDYQ